MKFIISSQNAGFTGAAPHCLQAPPAPASRGLSPQPRPKARGCGGSLLITRRIPRGG